MFDDDSLAGSWTALVDRLDAGAALPAWGAVEPALARFERITDLTRRLAPGCDPRAADHILGALIRIAAYDDDALLLALHLLAPTLLGLAAEMADLDANVLPVLVGEMACQIRSLARRGRTRAWGANLRWETRRAVLAELRPQVRRHPELGCELTRDGETWRVERPMSMPDEDLDLDVGDLLVWSVDRGVPVADVRLLVATECARADRDRHIEDCAIRDRDAEHDESGRGRPDRPSTVAWTGADARVAAAHGLCTRTLYRRRARTLSALRVHAADYLRAVA